LLLAGALAAAQFGRPQVSKGPRALGLLEIAPSGKAHLVPITIMIDGQFFDASAYKAAPVPMALEADTVYEGVRTGNSVGLFTVTGALHGPNNSWVGDGIWRLPSAEPAKKPREPEKPRMDEEEGPPTLKRPQAQKPSAPPAPSSNPAPSSAPPAPAAPPAASPPPAASVPASSSPAPAASPSPGGNAKIEAEPAPEPDPNRPVLRRGKPPQAAKAAGSESPSAPVPLAAAGVAKPGMVPATGAIQLIPAISDAAGPEPRPFTYELKPDEEKLFRTKMLALAAKELWTAGGGAPPAGNRPAAPARKPARAAGPPQPEFQDVQLRVFDLFSNNEPVLVLSAKAHLPQSKSPTLDYSITLVARSDMYGEVHKAWSKITDAQHLDVLPRYELIDAVDADGDGHGELLFREVSDAGTAFAVYRVIGNQLWPLFEGTPQ